MRLVTVGLLSAVVLFADLARGDIGTGSLKGIDSVCLAVENLRPENTGDLNHESLKKLMEAQIRKAGLRADCRPKAPALRLSVNILRTPGFTSASLQIRLEQEVRLARNGEMFFASTWSSELLSGAPAGAAYNDLKLDLMEIVDRFVSALAEANR